MENNNIQLLPESIKLLSKLNQLDLRGNPVPIPNIILKSKGLREMQLQNHP